MGGDSIPRRPPIWACPCGCKPFRKVDSDGNHVPVKVKLLKNIRKAPTTLINWSSNLAGQAFMDNRHEIIHDYSEEITTELDEHETLNTTAVSFTDAEDLAVKLVEEGIIGLNGRICTHAEVLIR